MLTTSAQWDAFAENVSLAWWSLQNVVCQAAVFKESWIFRTEVLGELEMVWF